MKNIVIKPSPVCIEFWFKPTKWWWLNPKYWFYNRNFHHYASVIQGDTITQYFDGKEVRKRSLYKTILSWF